jgi:hypothetical protein
LYICKHFAKSIFLPTSILLHLIRDSFSKTNQHKDFRIRPVQGIPDPNSTRNSESDQYKAFQIRPVQGIPDPTSTRRSRSDQYKAFQIRPVQVVPDPTSTRSSGSDQYKKFRIRLVQGGPDPTSARSSGTSPDPASQGVPDPTSTRSDLSRSSGSDRIGSAGAEEDLLWFDGASSKEAAHPGIDGPHLL